MDQPDTPAPPTFRHTLVRVMVMQLATLVLLALLQLRYNT